jgi:hypothetical protein
MMSVTEMEKMIATLRAQASQLNYTADTLEVAIAPAASLALYVCFFSDLFINKSRFKL